MYVGKDLICVGMMGCEFRVWGWENFFRGCEWEGSVS